MILTNLPSIVNKYFLMIINKKSKNRLIFWPETKNINLSNYGNLFVLTAGLKQFPDKNTMTPHVYDVME